MTYKSRVYSSVVGYRSKLEMSLKQDGAINVKIPSCPVDLPFVIVMRALGIKSDKEIADAVSPKPEIQDLLEVSFDKASEAPTDKDALVYIGNRVAHGMLEEFRVKRAQSMLDWGLLPHLGKTDDKRYDKAMFIGEAVGKLLELRLGWIEQDDKDHYGNKVIKFAGQMLADLFRTAFRNLVRDMKYQLERTGQKRGGNVVGAAIRTGIITDKLNNAIATGNWGRGKVGVTQLLDRTNYLSTLSHLRRVQSPLSRSQPNFEARDLHATHFGRICPSETPEGVNCGLVKNLALSAIISVSAPPTEVEEKLWELGAKPIRDSDAEAPARRLQGIHGREVPRIRGRRRKARQGLQEAEEGGPDQPRREHPLRRPAQREGVPAALHQPELGQGPQAAHRRRERKVSAHPELIEKVAAGQLSWRDLVEQGVIELIDANEEENCLVAMDPDELTTKNTHLELFPAAMFGIAASIIPYPEHNQSPEEHLRVGDGQAEPRLLFAHIPDLATRQPAPAREPPGARGQDQDARASQDRRAPARHRTP